MKSYLILFVIITVSYQCKAGLIDGFLTGALEVNSHVHNVAGAFLGGVSQALNHNRQPGHKPPSETVVVVVEEGPSRPPNGGPGYGGGRPPNQNGYGPNYDNRPQHNHGHHHHHGHGGGGHYGNQNPNNYNQNGNNWNPNNQYGNPNNQYGNPNQYGNQNNLYKPDNSHGTPNNHNLNPNNQYGNPTNQYGNPNNQNRPNNKYGNPNNQNGNSNNQNWNPNNQNWNPNNQFGNNGYNNQQRPEKPTEGGPSYQEQTTEHAGIKPVKIPSNDISTKPPIDTNHGYNSQKPHDEGHKTDQHDANNNQDKTTKKPDADDYPLFVPLKPNDYVYGGDKIDVNAPKRETGNSTPDNDKDEDLALDIRIDNK